MEHNDNNEKFEFENSQSAYNNENNVEENIIDAEYTPTMPINENPEPATVTYSSDSFVKNNVKEKKKKGKGLKKAMSYVLVGVMCSVIGGATALGAMMYVVPGSSAFKDSALYKALSQPTPAASSNVIPVSSPSNGSGMSVPDIVKKVSPAVVGVSTKSIVSSRSIFGNSNSMQEGMGTGVIFNDKGYIITNYHVIKGASQITVILNNNKQVKAKEINHDEANDIAIIQITDKVTLPGIAQLGNSDNIQVGESVVAIGNPLGELLGSVTTGIVSAVNRQIDGQNVKFIQTDAAINPGNSGGPLIDSQGLVIGINSEKMVSNGAEGLGFAIPINLIKNEISGLISNPIKNTTQNSTTTSQLMIGIGVQDIDQSTSQAENIPVGVQVIQVDQNSVAENAGIQVGDVITKFDGQTVQTSDELNALKAKHKFGDSVNIVVNRNGQDIQLTLKFIQQN